VVYNYKINKTRKDKKEKGHDWRPDLSCPKTLEGRENIALYKNGQYKKWKEKVRMKGETSRF